MFEKLKRKLHSQAGESIGETLVSLLIASLALVMLAGAISSSYNVIMKGRNQLNQYYSANEQPSGVVQMASGGSAVENGITIRDSTGAISPRSCKVTYYKNDQFNGKTVVAYKSSD